MKTAGVRGRAATTRSRWYDAGAVQQPHPPQAAGRRRRASASPAASASPTSGPATPRTPSTGATPTSASKGPVVAQMQAAFMDNWIKTTGTVLHGDDYFPALAPAGRRPRAGVQQLADRRQREHAADVPAVDRRGDADRSTCRTPTSCPTSWRVQALVAARRRGVQVRDHRARHAHRHRDRARARRARAGASCSRPASRSTSTSRRCSTAR